MKSLRNLTLIPLLIITALTPACVSRTVVSKVTLPKEGESRLERKGIFYALPQTVIKVDVPLVKTVQKMGKYVKFTEFFFPEEEFIKESGTKFTIDKPAFNHRGEPDPTKVYMIDLEGDRFTYKTLLAEFTEGGVMTKGEVETKDESLELLAAGTKTVAGLVAPFITAGGLPMSISERLAAQPVSSRPLRDTFPSRPPARDQSEDDFLKKASKEEKEFYEKLRDNEKEFYLSLSNLERAFYRTLSEEEREVYAELDNVERAFYRSLDQAERRFYRTLDYEERGFYQSLDNAERSFYRTLSEQEREFYRSLEEKERTYYTGLRSRQERKDFQDALKIFRHIQLLQREREKLISGQSQVPASSEALQVMLKEFDAIIDRYKNTYFLGTTNKDTWTGSFEFTPTFKQLSQALFSYSPTKGVCDLLVRQGVKVPPKYQKPEKECPGDRAKCNESEMVPAGCTGALVVSLNIAMGKEGKDELQLSRLLEVSTWDKDETRSFYYRVPATVLARLYAGEATEANEKGRAVLSVAQLGIEASLPKSTGGRRIKYALAIYESSGALKNFSLGSDALIQKSVLETFGGAGNTLIDASDELKRLERKRKILEELNKIKAEEDKLKGVTPNNP